MKRLWLLLSLVSLMLLAFYLLTWPGLQHMWPWCIGMAGLIIHVGQVSFTKLEQLFGQPKKNAKA